MSTKKTLQPQELSEQEELGNVQILLMTMKIVILIDWPKNLFTKEKKLYLEGLFEAHYGVCPVILFKKIHNNPFFHILNFDDGNRK